MGKYKQWLHHQEIGGRLRDQISTLEQERARVQKMAPTHPTSLPEVENPLIAALLAYTRGGHRLSEIDVIKAAMPDIGQAKEARKPASGASAGGAQPRAGATGGDAVVASLLARAEQMPADPLQQMQNLSRGREQDLGARPTPPVASAQPESVGNWWQRQQSEKD